MQINFLIGDYRKKNTHPNPFKHEMGGRAKNPQW